MPNDSANVSAEQGSSWAPRRGAAGRQSRSAKGEIQTMSFGRAEKRHADQGNGTAAVTWFE
jgi:hypothetical protein